MGGVRVMPLSRRQRAIMISVVSLQAAMCSVFMSRWDSSNVRPKAERTARVDWYISPVTDADREDSDVVGWLAVGFIEGE